QGDTTFGIKEEEEKRRTQYQSSVVMRELSGRTRFMLDNRTIEENIRGKKKGNMPFLRPDRTYYFAVSAYTSQGESEQSKETVAVLRPAPDL
ncbi:MAG TPA: fibronectin type III domain-containing protein, partial [Leptospiraceae bacterium]|nr:fibronectin type III domain-containing protein [Leptospiraceae bacterium]